MKEKTYEYSDFKDLKDVIEFLRKNPQKLKKELKYSAEKIMMLLDNEKMCLLEKEFISNKKGIDLYKFVWLMKRSINVSKENSFEFIYALVWLFNEIDINGDKKMEWSEFTQYIIDSVMRDYKIDKNLLKKLNEPEIESEILDQAYSKKAKKYQNSNIEDTSIHNSLIKKLKYVSTTKHLICLEENSIYLKIYNLNIKELYKLKPKNLSKFENDCLISDFDIIWDKNLILVTGSERRIYLFENVKHNNFIKYFECDGIMNIIRYFQYSKIVFTANEDNIIFIWNFSIENEYNLKLLRTVLAHDNIINDAIEISLSKFIATCSMDSTIKIWKCDENVLLTTLKDPSQLNKTKQMGIKGLTYTSEFNGILLSFGFNNYINIWSPDVSLSKSYVGKLEGHSSIVVSCKIMKKTPICISIDDKRYTRIWDLRFFTTIQLLRDETFNLINSVIETVTELDLFIIGSKRMIIFNNDYMKKDYLTFKEDINPIFIDFIPNKLLIIVISKIDIREYCAITGRLSNVFTNIIEDNNNEMISYTSNEKHRKLIIGDNLGVIKMINISNGEIIKKIDIFNNINDNKFNTKDKNVNDIKAVNCLIRVNEEKLYIVGCSNKIINLFEYDNSDNLNILRKIKDVSLDSEITTMSYLNELMLLASGDKNGKVSIYDLQYSQLDSILVEAQNEITNIEFLHPYPFILYSSLDGIIYIHALKKYSKLKIINQNVSNLCILKIYNINKEIINSNNGIVKSLLIKTDKKVLVKNSELYLAQKRIINSNDSKKLEQYENKEYDTINNYLENILKIKESLIKNNKYNLKNIIELKKKYFLTKENKLFYHLIVGDNNGNIHICILNDIWDILLLKYDINKKFDYLNFYKKNSIFLKRKDNINIRKYYYSFIEKYLNKKEKINGCEYISIEKISYLNCNIGYNPITNVLPLNTMNGFIVSTANKFIKFWNLNGDLIGQFNWINYNKLIWNFPYNYIESKMNSFDQVFSIYEKIYKLKLKISEKEEIIKKFLFNNYIKKEQNILIDNNYNINNNDELKKKVENILFNMKNEIPFEEQLKKIRDNKPKYEEKYGYYYNPKSHHLDLENFKKKIYLKGKDNTTSTKYDPDSDLTVETFISKIKSKRNNYINTNDSFIISENENHIKINKLDLNKNTLIKNERRIFSSNINKIDKIKPFRINSKVNKNWDIKYNLNENNRNLRIHTSKLYYNNDSRSNNINNNKEAIFLNKVKKNELLENRKIDKFLDNENLEDFDYNEVKKEIVTNKNIFKKEYKPKIIKNKYHLYLI